jgi:hypothetical protein
MLMTFQSNPLFFRVCVDKLYLYAPSLGGYTDKRQYNQ